jgi:hypothetical protein
MMTESAFSSMSPRQLCMCSNTAQAFSNAESIKATKAAARSGAKVYLHSTTPFTRAHVLDLRSDPVRQLVAQTKIGHDSQQLSLMHSKHRVWVMWALGHERRRRSLYALGFFVAVRKARRQLLRYLTFVSSSRCDTCTACITHRHTAHITHQGAMKKVALACSRDCWSS